MYYRRFAILGVVIIFLAHIDTGRSRPTSSVHVTAKQLRDRAVRQAAADSRLRHVVRNCTQDPNASDQDILDCMLPTIQTSGKCPPPPTCTPKTAQSLVAQYLQITKMARAFALSELPAAANSNIPQYVGFPDRGFTVNYIQGAANSTCFARSYKYIHLGEGYFPSIVLVVSECSMKPGCRQGNCRGRTLHPGFNDVAVLRREGDECEEDGTEKWMTSYLLGDFPLACSCGPS